MTTTSTRCAPGWPSFATAKPPTGRRDTAGPTDSGSARAELDAATAAHQRAIADCETHRKVAEAAAKRLGERATQASVAREKLTACYAELTVGRERLAQQRATATDDELARQGRGRHGEGAPRHRARRGPGR